MPRRPFLGQYILDADGTPVPALDTISWARWFEATMIFGGPADLNLSQWRYATREEALVGHADAVKIINALKRTG